MAMTAIVPGSDVSRRPPVNRNSASKSGTYKGRRFIVSDRDRDTDRETDRDRERSGDLDARARGKKMNSSISDLDKLLENDATALLNMRKDISHAQSLEVDKARATLAALQKEYDGIRTTNVLKEKELAGVMDDKKVLEGFMVTLEDNMAQHNQIIDKITSDIEEVEDNIQAEMRTRSMLTYLTSRLEQEIMDCKAQSHVLTQQLNQAKAEHTGLESTLRLSKHELVAEERHVEVLNKTIKSRTDQRAVKMQELQSMVMEGEQSIARVRRSLHNTLRSIKDNQETETKMGHGFESDPKPEVQPSSRVRGDSGNTDEVDSPEDALALTRHQIEEIVERYSSKESRIEKLNQVQSDLKEQLATQKSKKQSIEDILERSERKLQLLVSNRQMYQEVDMKDAALTTARKEGDDCRERDQRLRKGIESLRRAVPRFLQKVNKEIIPDGGRPVTIDMLPDVVHKLDDEVNKLIKQIGDRMLKDATSEDLATMSASVQEYSAIPASDNTSETSRLHKLPGYTRLQKQLFMNLMTAVPDCSEKNVRVTPAQTKAESDFTRQALSNDEAVGNSSKKVTSSSDYIDRATVKNISKLIVTKKDKVNSSQSSPGKRSRHGGNHYSSPRKVKNFN
mmetsp:Transcript_10429/g.15869  ORF Transcript_10429/g.15869 Transcript_10429/m.15869 type:complete len:622 (-) Transcript_10429:279-2144(-)